MWGVIISLPTNNQQSFYQCTIVNDLSALSITTLGLDLRPSFSYFNVLYTALILTKSEMSLLFVCTKHWLYPEFPSQNLSIKFTTIILLIKPKTIRNQSTLQQCLTMDLHTNSQWVPVLVIGKISFTSFFLDNVSVKKPLTVMSISGTATNCHVN